VRNRRAALVVSVVLATVCLGGAVASGQTHTRAVRPGTAAPHVTFKAPWYVFNKKTCQFVTANTHPKTFTGIPAKLNSHFTLAYLPEATGDPFDNALNAATQAAAVNAHLKFYMFSNAYPSTTAPLTVVGEAHSVHATSVIEANVVPTEYPAIQALFKKYCIPWLNEYDVPGSKMIPVFQADNYGTGAGMGTAAVKLMKARGWVAKDTYIVTCSDPSVGTNAGGVYDIDRGYRNTVAKLFPGSHIATPDISCSAAGGVASGIDGARSVMADWLTAHPQAKYVTAVSHIDSIYSLGMADALKAAGFGNRAIVAGRGGDTGYMTQIENGNPIIAVDGDPQFTKWGSPIVAMAEAIGRDQAVPSFVSPKVAIVTKANAKKYLG
jgi:hypothetical protein